MEVWSPSSVGVALPLASETPPSSLVRSILPTLQWLAAQPEVEWIEAAAAFETMNKHAASTIQVTTHAHHRHCAQQRATSRSTHRCGRVVWQSGSVASMSHPLWERNVTGAGQVVSIGDTGVAWASCFFNDPAVPVPIDTVDHSHRKVVTYRAVHNKTYDLRNGHGTHTVSITHPPPATPPPRHSH